MSLLPVNGVDSCPGLQPISNKARIIPGDRQLRPRTEKYTLRTKTLGQLYTQGCFNDIPCGVNVVFAATPAIIVLGGL